MRYLPFSRSSITSMMSAIVLGTIAHRYIPGIDLRSAFFLILIMFGVFTLEGIESQLLTLTKQGIDKHKETR